MANDVKISNTKLLYDPLFSQKPDVKMKGKKHLTFKIAFIVIIVIFVGISLYLSFNSLSADKYTYKETENGWQLYQFNGKEDDKTLHIDYVRDKNGKPNEQEPVATVREFAMSCNEYVQFIFIGKDVKELEPHCFYYTKHLKAIIVDPNNPDFTAVDGVLYNKEMTEILLHPIDNDEYCAALAAGFSAPADEAEAKKFIADFTAEFGEETVDNAEDYKTQFSEFSTYVIPDTVTVIGDSCFSDCETLTEITVPDGVKTIGSLAFFKCKKLESIYIPDGAETIGSDAFSYIYNEEAADEESGAVTLTYIYVPASVKSIGHHAFYGDLGCKEIYMGAANEAAVETGEHWLPKQSTRSMKDIEAVYGQTRRAK